MTTEGTGRGRPWDRAFSYARDRSALRDAAHIFVLTAFAVAQPVYDLLGRNAEFFVAHRSTRGDILTLVLLLSVGLPAAIALVRYLAGLVSSRAGNTLHALIVFGGVTLMATFAALYYWFPKMFGRMMNETLGRVHFWGTFVPFFLIFFIQHFIRQPEFRDLAAHETAGFHVRIE